MRPDAVLVAAEPGDLTGAEVVQVLAKRTTIPVVVGIGDGQGEQAGAALSFGATACIARPYRLSELIPIMKSIRPDHIGMLEPPIECGGLRFPMVHADRVLTPDQIYGTLWGQRSGRRSNTLVVHIRRLRARLGDNQENPHIIKTVQGVGYRLIPRSRALRPPS